MKIFSKVPGIAFVMFSGKRFLRLMTVDTVFCPTEYGLLRRVDVYVYFMQLSSVLYGRVSLHYCITEKLDYGLRRSLELGTYHIVLYFPVKVGSS